jgi:hypothetical protein
VSRSAWLMKVTLNSTRFGFGLLVIVASAFAQELSPAVDEPVRSAAAGRWGRYRFGPFYWTPSLHVGTIGLDTNVFYTQTDRQSDLMASGGPALDVVMPLRGSLRADGVGVLDYNYFHRTTEQRHLGGQVVGGLKWGRVEDRTRLSIHESWQRSISRPGFEVDLRMENTIESTIAELSRRLFGRYSLVLTGMRMRSEVGEGETFHGVDLRSTLSRVSFSGRASLEYRWTIKTTLFAEAERQHDRFLFDRLRDARWDRVVGGIRTDASALISGHATMGYGWYRRGALIQEFPTASVDATLNISKRTHVGGSYYRERMYSALATTDGSPILRTTVAGAHFDRDLIWRFNLRLFARRSWLGNHGPIIASFGQYPVTIRRDQIDEAGVDLGYRFRTHLRIGVMAAYTERYSNIADFGVDGLLMGLSVQYNP